MKALFIEGNRNGYHPTQCGRTLTVGELIEILQEYDEDREIYLRNDNGYTYGSIKEYDLTIGEYNDSRVILGDEEEEEW